MTNKQLTDLVPKRHTDYLGGWEKILQTKDTKIFFRAKSLKNLGPLYDYPSDSRNVFTYYFEGEYGPTEYILSDDITNKYVILPSSKLRNNSNQVEGALIDRTNCNKSGYALFSLLT